MKSEKPFDDQKQQLNTGEGMRPSFGIEAAILDSEDNLICELDEMINGAINSWEAFINQHNLVS